ncbi:MAG: hypothetical protein J6X18_05405 [Bacteroidales bacterium]|nr:hypothetical protein [Bacteroidales bacterium]
MKHYISIPRFKDDKSLLGEDVFAFNKLDGQNLCVKYLPKRHLFQSFGSRRCVIDENSEVLGDAVSFFKESNIPMVLSEIVDNNRGKRGEFCGVDEITFYFEWWGEHSFAGFHVPGDKMHLSLIDVFEKKKGLIEPKVFTELFVGNDVLDCPELIYKGKLTNDFIESIEKNDWTKPDAVYPSVKEGVVITRSTRLPGQYLPKCKVKTSWWLNELHSRYTEDRWKELE